MATINYKAYDQGEVESIRLMLDSEAKEGKPLFFDVKVDGNTRIHKTDKVERFEELYNFINDNTKELVINIYPDASKPNRKEWYKYSFGNANQSLNGVDMEEKLNDRMKAFEEKQATKRTEEKLQDALQQLQEAEDYIRILEDKAEAQKVKPNHFGEWDLAKLASSTIEGIAVHHPAILEKVPMLNGIAKVIQHDVKTKPAQLNGSFEGDVSFKPKETRTELSPEEQEEEAIVRNLVGFMGSHFKPEEIDMVGLIIEALGSDPSKIKTIAELLNISHQNQTVNEEE